MTVACRGAALADGALSGREHSPLQRRSSCPGDAAAHAMSTSRDDVCPLGANGEWERSASIAFGRRCHTDALRLRHAGKVHFGASGAFPALQLAPKQIAAAHTASVQSAPGAGHVFTFFTCASDAESQRSAGGKTK